MPMERRPSKREHGQPHESHSHRTSQRHRPTETEQYVSMSKKRSSHDERPKEGYAKPDLSGDGDHVWRWLAQIDQQTKPDTKRPRNQETKTEHHDTRQKLQLELRSFRQAAFESDNTQLQSKPKRRHRSTSDSSLLKPVVKPEPRPRKGVEPNLRGPKRGIEPVPGQQKKRKAALSDSGSSADSVARKETFEKRDRHKTREDHYEPKKRKQKLDKTDGERKSKRKREKKGDKKRESKKAGQDVMNHFSSKSIGQERLTIRLTHGPGLFQNGRASSPFQRRGLPDLVFSEMEFLQHSSRNQVPQDISKVTSKSRERNKHRASREQDEISMFFKPRPPLSETSPNARKERSSIYMSDERPTYIKHRVLDQTQPHSQSLGSTDKSYVVGQPTLSSDLFSVSHGRTPSMQRLRTMPDTTSRLSENTRTRVRWLETQMSPGATAASRRRKHEYHRSPTPEAIRKSIENTGIFRDTGIGGSPGLTFSRSRPTPPHSFRQNQLRDVQGTLEDLERTADNTNVQEMLAYKRSESHFKCPDSTSRHQTPQLPQNREVILRGASERPRKSWHESPTTSREDPATKGRSRIIVERYDPELGWHQQQDQTRPEEKTATPSMDTAPLRGSNNAPKTREEIAKLARVKRPATTLPITRVPEQPRIHSGNNTGVPIKGPISNVNTGISTTWIIEKPLPGSPKAPETLIAGISPAQNSLNGVQGMLAGRGLLPDFLNNYNQSLESHPQVSMKPQFKRDLNTGVDGKHAVLTSQSESTRLEPTIATGFPVRGPMRSSFGQPSRTHSAPVVGPGPLYFNQIQRQFAAEEPIFEDEPENDPPEDHFAALGPEAVPYLEDIEDDMLESQPYADHGYDEDPFGEGQEEFGYGSDYAIDAPQAWQPVVQGGDIVDQYETWEEHGQELGNNYEIAEASYGGNTEYGLEVQEIVYENPMADEELSLQGFWRSRRPY